MKPIKNIFYIIIIALALQGCSLFDQDNDGNVKPAKKVSVYGVHILATEGVPDAKLSYAAKVLAKYLDSNDDGTVNNQAVIDSIVANKAIMMMTETEEELENISEKRLRELGFSEYQSLYSDRTNPNWIADEQFDESIEEILHLITQFGYSKVYSQLGESAGTQLANAMDTARGGHFTTVPTPYPDGAWYTYDDTSCEYNCMITEYFYWILTSMLGGQSAYANREFEINHEWTLNTAAKVQATDTAGYALMTDGQYKLPTVLPDGNYTSTTFTIESI